MQWPGGFSWCYSLFHFGSHYKQNQSKCRNPHADPNPDKPLLQRDSSRHSRPRTVRAGAHRGKANPKSTNSRAPSALENKALHSRLRARRQPCPEPFPQRRRMRQCKPMSNTAPRASCSQGYHGPCTAGRNPQRYLCGLLGCPHHSLRERGLPKIRGRWSLWQPFPTRSSSPAAWDRDGLSYLCLCSTQLPPGTCQ